LETQDLLTFPVTASIKTAASTIAHGMMTYYTGNQSTNPTAVGTFPAPYYWWEAGAVWGALIDYHHLTNDSTYNTIITQAIVSQVSPTFEFMPPTEAGQEGNDDQLFWAFASLSALESSFPSLPSPNPSYLSLSTAVFTDLVNRWDSTTCNGGLHWQILPSNPNGYSYKNSAANGGFFQLCARLYRYTGNSTYLSWAEKSWDWMAGVQLLSTQGSAIRVYDGTQSDQNCSQVNRVAFSYTQGMALYGAAALANATYPNLLWLQRAEALLAGSASFFSPYTNASNVMYEPACESQGTCDTDQYAFKGLLARWLAKSAQLVPDLSHAVTILLETSALAATASCSGLGQAGNSTCGTKWYVNGFDGNTGLGQQFSALEVIQGLLATEQIPPVVGRNVTYTVVAAATTVAVPRVTPGAGDPDGGAGLGMAPGGARLESWAYFLTGAAGIWMGWLMLG
jgi:mannan endo-1,6-alpha-mannosidase